jgi:hypothetical protein
MSEPAAGESLDLGRLLRDTLWRRRPMFMTLVPLVMWAFCRAEPRSFWIGVAVFAVGEAIRWWAAGTIRKDQGITEEGPYALVRHPLYFGSLLVAVGYCAMTNRWEAWAIVLPLFIAFHWAAILHEEERLHREFGAAYGEYSAQVPRLIPRTNPAARQGRFTWKQALANREHLTLLTQILLILLYALVAYRVIEPVGPLLSRLLDASL